MATKIVRKVYNDLGQADLLAYAANVLRCCESHATLSIALSADLAQLRVSHDELREALSELVNGGRLQLERKNRALAAVYRALSRLVLSIEYQDLGNQAVLEAGLTPMPSGPPAKSGTLDPPRDVRAVNTAVPGEVALTFRLPQPRRVHTNAVEFSLDHGATWQPGVFSRNSRVRLGNLPVRADVQLRVASIGAAGRGGWSDPVTVFVL
jgi:hypothetical protein